MRDTQIRYLKGPAYYDGYRISYRGDVRAVGFVGKCGPASWEATSAIGAVRGHGKTRDEATQKMIDGYERLRAASRA